MVTDTSSSSTIETIIGVALLIFVLAVIWRWAGSRRQR